MNATTIPAISFVLTTAADAFKHSYSVEAGLADNVNHFDHHKSEHRHFPSPCNNPAITPRVESGTCAITHIDADTFVGCLRLVGGEIPSLDLELMQHIDLNGSSVISNPLNNDTYHYMVGIGQIARDLKFPRPDKEQDIDVSDIISDMMSIPWTEIVAVGRESTLKSEQDYEFCSMEAMNGVLLIRCDSYHAIDPSRGYKDGYHTVVIYRKHYKSISIYTAPSNDKVVKGEWAGIVFDGHPKACGSPRGEEMLFSQAVAVYEALAAS